MLFNKTVSASGRYQSAMNVSMVSTMESKGRKGFYTEYLTLYTVFGTLEYGVRLKKGVFTVSLANTDKCGNKRFLECESSKTFSDRDDAIDYIAEMVSKYAKWRDVHHCMGLAYSAHDDVLYHLGLGSQRYQLPAKPRIYLPDTESAHREYLTNAIKMYAQFHVKQFGKISRGIRDYAQIKINQHTGTR